MNEGRLRYRKGHRNIHVFCLCSCMGVELYAALLINSASASVSSSSEAPPPAAPEASSLFI